MPLSENKERKFKVSAVPRGFVSLKNGGKELRATAEEVCKSIQSKITHLFTCGYE